jgi:hypothetical protein
MATAAADLVAIEARLQRVLDPYRDRLELASIYNTPALRKPRANAHNWFAFVKPASKHVGFYLLPMHTHPDLREGLSPALAKRLTGKSVFTFQGVDEALFAELEAVVTRAFGCYMDGP